MTEEIPTAREQTLARSDDPMWPEFVYAAEKRFRRQWARSQSRFWYDKRADCVGRKRLPWFGGDEYGRKTLVIPIPFHGDFHWAFWTWTGKEDDAAREQTWEHEIFEKVRPRVYEKTFVYVNEYPHINVDHMLDDCDLRWTMYLEGDPTETIDCAAYPMDWCTLRLFPIDLEDTTVTVRVEVGDIGTGLVCKSH